MYLSVMFIKRVKPHLTQFTAWTGIQIENLSSSTNCADATVFMSRKCLNLKIYNKMLYPDE